MPTIVIAGAGPLVGYSIAKHFGLQGYDVALIARRRQVLDELVEKLTAAGISAAAFPADLTDTTQVDSAFAAIRERFGTIDILEFSPTDWNKGGEEKNNTAVAITPDVVEQDFRLLVLGAVACVQNVLPDMRRRNQGALLFTTGYSAIQPLSFIASLGISNSGLRNYAYCLGEDLAETGIYVGTISINIFIQPGTDGDPDKVAELYDDMYRKRDRLEAVFGPAGH